MECGNWTDPNVPNSGWVCTTIMDTGQVLELCAMCQKEHIRYVHTMYHPDTGMTLDVGCVCAGKMSGLPMEAKIREGHLKKMSSRRKNWLTHSGWKRNRKGNDQIKTKENYFIVVFKKQNGWGMSIKNARTGLDRLSQRYYPTKEEAKMAIFDVMAKYMQKEMLKETQISFKVS